MRYQRYNQTRQETNSARDPNVTLTQTENK